MDSLTTSEVGLGSAALTTAIIAWLKNLGLAPNQRWILLWAMVIPILVQVLLTLSQVTPVTTQGIAAAILAGITSGLAAGGIHDHTSAAAEKVSQVLAPPPAASILSEDTFQRSIDAIDADAALTPGEKAAAKDALAKFRTEVKPPDG